jgi:hypothetical protein
MGIGSSQALNTGNANALVAPALRLDISERTDLMPQVVLGSESVPLLRHAVKEHRAEWNVLDDAAAVSFEIQAAI